MSSWLIKALESAPPISVTSWTPQDLIDKAVLFRIHSIIYSALDNIVRNIPDWETITIRNIESRWKITLWKTTVNCKNLYGIVIESKEDKKQVTFIAIQWRK